MKFFSNYVTYERKSSVISFSLVQKVGNHFFKFCRCISSFLTKCTLLSHLLKFWVWDSFKLNFKFRAEPEPWMNFYLSRTLCHSGHLHNLVGEYFNSLFLGAWRHWSPKLKLPIYPLNIFIRVKDWPYFVFRSICRSMWLAWYTLS